MIQEQTKRILEKLLEATQKGALSWSKDEHDDWHTAQVDGREINIRFLYFEATNQVGADRHSLQLSMPGLSGFFASGTEGYYLLLETLAEAFNEYQPATNFAIEFLDKAIATTET